jgi:hypothetical protein
VGRRRCGVQGRDCAALYHEGTKDTKDHEEQQLRETVPSW